jgi:hypothetical protein
MSLARQPCAGERLFSKPAGRDQPRINCARSPATAIFHSAVAAARDGKILFADIMSRE